MNAIKLNEIGNKFTNNTNDTYKSHCYRTTILGKENERFVDIRVIFINIINLS